MKSGAKWRIQEDLVPGAQPCLLKKKGEKASASLGQESGAPTKL